MSRLDTPYRSTAIAAERLYKEYLKHPRLCLAVDFDSTIFPWENKTDTFNDMIGLLKRCSDLDFYITIYTASIPERFEFMKSYVESFGIKVTSVNRNPIDLPYGNDGEIYYEGQAMEILENVLTRIGKENLIKT